MESLIAVAKRHDISTLREVLDQLDGAGMILVDYDEIKQALRIMGLTLDTPVTAEPKPRKLLPDPRRLRRRV
jgi:hypothetical protein